MVNAQFDRKIAIMDYVGSKAGMDYYDTQLLDALADLKYTTFLFGNFKSIKKSKTLVRKVFSDETPKNILIKTIDYCAGFIRSAIEYKFKHKGSLVLLHFFEATPKDFFTVRLLHLFGFKIILIVHDVSAFGNKEIEAMRKKIFNISSSIVLQNEFSRKELLDHLSSSNKEKISITRHGNFVSIINKNISKELARNALDLDKNKKYILFFGQIKKVKGLDVLLKAMPNVGQDIDLIIAGKTWKDSFNFYQKIIDSINIDSRVQKNIKFISDEERELYLKACDALILPYNKIYQSGVLLMGMSYCLPVVASDLEANREVISDNENGVLFKTGDSEDLSAKINYLFSINGLIDKISIKAENTMMEKYNWQGIAEDYNKIFTTTIKN